jgi:hypothetical protein
MNFGGPPSTTLPILLTPHYQRAHAEFMSGSQTKAPMKVDKENEAGSKKNIDGPFRARVQVEGVDE